jgi:predicted transglutaminase-like cysteine proteinase
MRRDLVSGLVMMVLGFVLPTTAHAIPNPQVSGAADGLLPLANAMPDSHAEIPAPPGFISFCVRFADQCATPKNEPAIAPLTPAMWNDLQEINESVNRAITPMDDLHHYGVAEYWTIPSDGRGDCEDYALMKRRALIARGFPARALRLAIVKTWDDQRHAVLTVATDHGDYVLDNLVQNVRSWDNVDYQWLARQDPNDGWGWVSLSPGSPQPLLSASNGGQHG